MWKIECRINCNMSQYQITHIFNKLCTHKRMQTHICECKINFLSLPWIPTLCVSKKALYIILYLYDTFIDRFFFFKPRPHCSFENYRLQSISPCRARALSKVPLFNNVAFSLILIRDKLVCRGQLLWANTTLI